MGVQKVILGFHVQNIGVSMESDSIASEDNTYTKVIRIPQIAVFSSKNITIESVDVEHRIELVLQAYPIGERLAGYIAPRIQHSQLDKWKKMPVNKIGAIHIDWHG